MSGIVLRYVKTYNFAGVSAVPKMSEIKEKFKQFLYKMCAKHFSKFYSSIFIEFFFLISHQRSKIMNIFNNSISVI